MSNAIGALRAELSASAARFQSDMGKARRAVQSESTAMQRAFGRAGQAGQRLVSSIFNVRNAAIAAAGMAGLMALSRSAIATADEIGKTARTIGTTAEELQELRFAAGRAGVGTSELDSAMVRFARTLGQAQRGQKTQLDLFKELNVAIKDTEGNARSVNDVFQDVSNAISRIDDPARSVALTMEIFGRSGARMARFLGQGSDEINRLRERAQELGVVISNDMIARAEQANDELSDMAQVFRVAGLNLALDFMPVMQELAGIFTSGDFQRGVRSASEEIRRMVQWMVDNSEVIMRVVGALAGMRMGRVAGGPGMIAGGVAGAFLPEMLRSETESLQREFDNNKKQITEWRDMLAQPGAQNFGIVDDLEHLIEEVETRQGQIFARLYEIRNAGEEVGDQPRLNVPPPIDPLEWEDAGETIKRTGQRISDAQREAQRVFEQTRTAAERYAETIAKLDELLAKGLITQDTYNRAVAQAAEALERAEDQFKDTAEAARFFESAMDHALTSIIPRIETGNDALDNLLNTLIQVVAQAALLGRGPLAGLLGGGGGLFGGLLGGGDPWAGLRGFYRGGDIKVGGAGGLDSQVAAMRVTPGETISIRRPGEDGGGGFAGLHVTVGWSRDADGNLKPFIEEVADARAGAAVSQGLSGYEKVRRKRHQAGAEFG